jgi:hypothetical protein
MPDDEITIYLANGAEKIENCKQKVPEYCRPIRDDDSSGVAAFELYDQIPGSEDDQLTVYDIWLANGITAGIQQNHVIELWQNEESKERIEQLLAQIPKQIGLESDDLDPKIFENLKDLLEKWMDLDGWAAARVTKVLHKTRPTLLPPIDSQVMTPYSELRQREGKRRWRFYESEAEDVVEVVRRIRDDIRNEGNLAQLRAIQQSLKHRGIRLSISRIFDIILYQHLDGKRRRQNPV